MEHRDTFSSLMLRVCCLAGLYGFGVSLAYGEVVLDGSMQACEPSCDLTGPDYQINSGDGQIRGQNLFHSFGEFNLNSAESATFNGPASVQNIVSRVTGGNLSSIDGTINSTINGANLWLINPAGMVFGPNARLNISGSFHASTADYLVLGSDGRFGADTSNPANSVLTTSPPSAFGFLDNVVAPITVQGSQLEVPTGKTLSLVAGDIEIIGQGGNATVLDLGVDPVTLRAASGQVNLVSVASQGEVNIVPAGLDPGSMTLGTITMTDGAAVTTRGDPGGTIYIRAGRFVMQNSILDSATLGTNNHTGKGMDIQVTHDMHVLSGLGSVSGISGGSAIFASAYGTGSAGNILINAGELFLQGDPDAGVYTSIASRVFGTGASGNIEINSDTFQLDKNSAIVTQSFASGDSGDIAINSRLVNINGTEGLAFISTSAFNNGNAGDLTVTADEIVAQGNNGFVGLATQVTSGSNATANAGVITVTANSIKILDGAQFNASIQSGSGNGGGIDVTANDILISGKDSNAYSAGIFTNINGSAASSGGDILVNTTNLSIIDGGQINSEVGFWTPGAGGRIELNTTNLQLGNGGKISSTTYGSGAAGNIQIKAANIDLNGINPDGTVTGIFAAAGTVGGHAGNINIIASQLDVRNGARISSQTFGLGNAGLIDIQADYVSVSGYDFNSGSQSRISASSEIFPGYAAYAGGQGGGITINAGQVEISDQGQLTTHTVTKGNGGNILINTGKLSLTNEAIISANSTASGVAGDIAINATDSIWLADSMISSEASQSTGGNISLHAASLIQLNNSAITAAVLSGGGQGGSIALGASTIELLNASHLSATNQGTGNAGSISLLASDTVRLDRSDITTEAAAGNGGNIRLQAGESLYATGSQVTASVLGGAGTGGTIEIDTKNAVLNATDIASTSNGTGTAGDIKLVASDALEMLGSSITTEATRADGGNISIMVQRFIYLDHSAITASVSGGAGNGGNIFIDPELMVIKSSRITANAHGGKGGNVTIIAGNLITSPDSVISASSKIGIDGEVIIDAPNRDLNADLVILPESMLDASKLFRNDCAAVGGNYSSFVVSDSLQASGGLLSPAYYIDEEAMQLSQSSDNRPEDSSAQMDMAFNILIEPPRGGCQATSHVF